MTEPEVILWSRLKRLRGEGFHIRRQAPFRGYYLDFVCFDRRLVVELDGGHHGEAAQAAHDLVRDTVLRGEGFRVLRFWNSAVRQNLDGVMYSILAALRGDD
jgi:very-short-patch-repair endonuclease